MKNVKDAIKIILILFLDKFVKNVLNIHSQMRIELPASHMIQFYQRKVLIICFFIQGLISIVRPIKIFISAIKIKLLLVQLNSKMIRNCKTKICYFSLQIVRNLIQICLSFIYLSNPQVYSKIIPTFTWSKTLGMLIFLK